MVHVFSPADLPLNDFPINRQQPNGLTAPDHNLDRVPVPVPAVEVIEVDDDSAWALWEDSVAFQDSQFSDAAAFASTSQVPLEPLEKTAEYIDPFASVHPKSR